MAGKEEITPDSLKLAAEMAAFRLLIRELVTIVFGRMPDGVRLLDGYIERMKTQTENITLKHSDPSVSDAVSAEISESVVDLLQQARENLATQMSRAGKQSS